MVNEISPALAEELRRLKEDLPLAIKRADEAAGNDPRGVVGDPIVARRAQLASEKVSSIRRRIADIEGEQTKASL
jgi:hypothetical protein